MTSNRARKRAARAIAAEKNIRYPEAAALANDKATSDVPDTVQELVPYDLQKVRIVFSRRYADLLAAELDGAHTLDLLAVSMAAIPSRAAQMFSEAIPGVRKELSVGSTTGSAWARYRSLLGVPLFHMLQIMDITGPSPTLLRATADTMESELRLGVF